MTAAPPLTMLTFAPMVDSECTRLVLRHYGLEWRERDHLFGWASLLTLVHGGYGRVPLCYGGGVHASGPMALVDRFDTHTDSVRRLLPPEQPLRQQVEADWARFNNDLAFSVATFAYSHLLPMKAAMIRAFRGPIPSVERALTPALYPLIRGLFTLLLHLSPARAADALLRIRLILDQADARLADGRKHMLGSTRTLSDLALASAIAPLLLPLHYARFVPPENELPDTLRAAIAETRARPVAALAGRVYHDLMRDQ